VITWLFPTAADAVDRVAVMLAPVLAVGNGAILVYFLVINTVYLALLLLAARHLVQYVRGAPTLGLEEVFQNPFTPGVTVLVPAYNEGPNIVTSVTSLLGLRYPDLEVVVVNDGSSDDTLARLVEHFDLGDC
jgi:cellulose synthase/poly-beta-1,6-N-acetylglucosamine synthase-like glycosyltransferase